jgi:hypothetical protein
VESAITIESPLSPDEALSRLREQVGGDLPLLMMPIKHPERPLRGRVGGRDFAVRLRTQYANAIAAVFHGTIEPSGTGSRLRATRSMPLTTMLMVPVWFIAAGGFGLDALREGDWPMLLGALGGVVFGLGLVAFGVALARRETRVIIVHLRTTVGLAPSPGQPNNA